MPEDPEKLIRLGAVLARGRGEEAAGHQDRRGRNRQPGDPQPEPGQAGLVDVQEADQAEDDQDAGMAVTGPRERLLEVRHRHLTADDPGHEVAAELDRDDSEQDHPGDDP
jgi:hypothetical protein